MVSITLNKNYQLKRCFHYLFSGIVFCLLIAQPIFAQLVFEDTKGEEVLVQYMGGSFFVNSANESIKIGYTLRNGTDWCLGVDVAAKAANGIASLLKSGDLTPGVKMNLNIGYVFNSEWRKKNFAVYNIIDGKRRREEKQIEERYQSELDKLKMEKGKCSEEALERVRELLKEKKETELAELKKKLEQEAENRLVRTIPKQTSWINLKVGYEKESFKIFSPEASFENQIKNEGFNGFSVQLSYQSYLFDYNNLVNVSLGIRRTNNVSELKKVELTDELIYGNSGQTTRLNKKTFTAWEGTFERFNVGYILLSSFWKPTKAQVGVLTYSRYNYSRLTRTLNFGLGGFVLKSKENKTGFVPLGGIIVEYEDKFGSETKDISFGDRISISLVLNIPFLTN